MDSIDKINLHLARLGMSGADLERKIGVSNSVYSQWNTKSTKPSKKSLMKVADALGVDVSELMPDSLDKKEKPSAESEELDETRRKINRFLDKATPSQRELILSFLETAMKMGENNGTV